MSEPLFKGAITPIVTPFRDDAIDADAFVHLVERQVRFGVHALLAGGATGEGDSLTGEEHQRTLALCVRTVAGRIPVIAGAAAASTAEALGRVRAAAAAGAQAALVSAPSQNRPSQEGLYRHFAALAAADLPILIHDAPGGEFRLSDATVAGLADLEGVAGLGDPLGDLARLSLLRRSLPPDFALMTGHPPTALGYMAHGGHGCIAPVCNVAPKAFSTMIQSWIDQDWSRAQETQARMARLLAVIQAEPVSASKFALSRMGALCTEEVRLPLSAWPEERRQSLMDAMAQAADRMHSH